MLNGVPGQQGGVQDAGNDEVEGKEEEHGVGLAIGHGSCYEGRNYSYDSCAAHAHYG